MESTQLKGLPLQDSISTLSGSPSVTKEEVEPALNKRKENSFSQHYITENSNEPSFITLDHCYSKNWYSQSDLSYAQTAKFVSWTDNLKSEPQVSIGYQEEEILDVESCPPIKDSQFDANKTIALLTECERAVKKARPHTNFSTDDPINRTGWTVPQNKLFNRVYKALMNARLSRLANGGSPNEAIQRRIYADKCAKRLRQVFATACWDEELLTWLHTVCMNNLSSAMLSDYLEALQTLRAKIPSLVDKMIKSSEHYENASAQCVDAVDLLLKRPWDPLTAMPSRGKLEKLPKNPILIIVPQIPISDSNTHTVKNRRAKLWNTQLAHIAKVIIVPSPNITKSNGKWECFDAMVGAVRTTIAETKELYPSKPIILMGWNFGALLSIYVGSMEKISAVVAMGYPIMGLNGLRGDADDVIMDSITPTLFVVGEHAQMCPIADLENMREKMRAENHLIVVAGANDRLNINFKTKKGRSLTQSIVDRCMLDEIRSYLEKILTTPSNVLTTKISLSASIDKVKKKKTKISPLNAYAGNKIITSVKAADGIPPVGFPRKRKSPTKESKSKKQMKLAAQSDAIRASMLEQEQLAAISAIAPTTSINDPLNLSNSSQGSLTALHPPTLSFPQLVSSSDSGSGAAAFKDATPYPVKLEPSEVNSGTRHARIYPAQPSVKKGVPPKPSTPTYIQLCGSQTGQSFAISVEKARELMNMGLLRSVERSKVTDRMNNFDTTRQLLSLPPGTTIGIASSTANVPTQTAKMKRPNESASAGNKQIRNLLSTSDGKLVLQASRTSVVQSVSPLDSTATSVEKLAHIVRQAPTNLSPGQSLIRRKQASAATVSGESSISRQLLANSPQDNVLSKTISVVVNQSYNTPVSAAKSSFANLKAVSPLKTLDSSRQVKSSKPSELAKSITFNTIRTGALSSTNQPSAPAKQEQESFTKIVATTLTSAISKKPAQTISTVSCVSSNSQNKNIKELCELRANEMQSNRASMVYQELVDKGSKLQETNQIDNLLQENMASPSASSTLSAQSTQDFVETEILSTTETVIPSLLPSASMFNPEAEISLQPSDGLLETSNLSLETNATKITEAPCGDKNDL